MFDPAFDRTLSYRLSSAYGCWGHRRSLRRGTRNGIWFLDATTIDEPLNPESRVDSTAPRQDQLAELRSSEHFTPIELATLEALVVERMTIAEIAQRDGCSRQAVLARIVGNSRGQGGILKKVRALRVAAPLLLCSAHIE